MPRSTARPFNRLAAALALAMATPVAALLSAPAYAENMQSGELGLPVGAQAPLVTGVTQENAPKTFDQLTGENGLVLAFFRSADWCPYCKGQLRDLNTIAADLDAKGYKLAALSYDSVDTLKEFSEKNAIAYTLLSDPQSEIIDAFGVRNEEMRGKKRFDGIPHPAIFFISPDGVIKAKLYEEGYKNRPQTAAILETAASLQNGS